MYQKLTLEQQELVKKVMEITITDYGVLGDFIPIDSLIYMVEDIFNGYENLKEEFDNYKQYVADNYREIPQAEQYGINEAWFH